MKVKRILVTGAVAVGLIAAFTAVAESRPRPGPGVPGEGGNFSSRCGFSHRLPDDPIVFPGQPGASHSHDFFANVTTGAGSTLDSLLAGETTCNRPEDTAAYWVPTLSLNGVAVRPVAASAYYNARGKDLVAPPPAGLRIIAGDARATSAQRLNIVQWHCGEGGPIPPSSTPPTCPPRIPLRLQIRFPDCWNGRDLDSADHKSHLAYSMRAHCPSSHPVGLAGLRLTIIYPIRGGSGVSLASGGVLTGHADFFNAWSQAELARLTTVCLNLHQRCGRRG